MSTVDLKFRHLEMSISSNGARVESERGPTLELIGQVVSFDSEEVLELAGRHLREDHPELVSISREVPRLTAVLGKRTSRRAVAYVGVRSLDGEELECLPLVQFLVRGEVAMAFVYVRSLDVRGKFEADSIAGSRCLAEISKLTGVEVGTLTFFVASAHVYI
jgi:hypothetical protein